MARDTKCSQSTLSLIAAGTKKPGKRVLSLIAETHGVNAKWLFEGIGEPTSLTPGTSLHLDYTLPIYERPLPGAPGARSNAFTGRRFEVMPVYARPENYLLELGRDEPILCATDLGLKKGDLLIIATDRRYIPSERELFEDLVVIRDKPNAENGSLARVDYIPRQVEEGPAHLAADLFERDVMAEKQKRGEIRKVTGKRGFYFEKVERENGKEKIVRMTHLQLDPPCRAIEYADIVGVCRGMIRTRL
jgi:hypothetical protein